MKSFFNFKSNLSIFFNALEDNENKNSDDIINEIIKTNEYKKIILPDFMKENILKERKLIQLFPNVNNSIVEIISRNNLNNIIKNSLNEKLSKEEIEYIHGNEYYQIKKNNLNENENEKLNKKNNYKYDEMSKKNFLKIKRWKKKGVNKNDNNNNNDKINYLNYFLEKIKMYPKITFKKFRKYCNLSSIIYDNFIIIFEYLKYLGYIKIEGDENGINENTSFELDESIIKYIN